VIVGDLPNDQIQNPTRFGQSDVLNKISRTPTMEEITGMAHTPCWQ